ncbi:MAG TPA: hypothetical protein VJZ49_00720 [Syntrophales bacterium]|nr:hypothetical protein [Syntrophales bacterium]
MQVIGWIGIIIGLLHYRKVSSLFLIIIGIAVVYAVRESKKNETELASRLVQAKIRMTRRFKKASKVAMEQTEGDFLMRDLKKPPKPQSQEKNVKKSDWFIYGK